MWRRLGSANETLLVTADPEEIGGISRVILGDDHEVVESLLAGDYWVLFWGVVGGEGRKRVESWLALVIRIDRILKGGWVMFGDVRFFEG